MEVKSYIEQASESFDHFIQSKEFNDSVNRVEQDKELIEFAEKMAANSVPLDREIQKIINEKFHDL